MKSALYYSPNLEGHRHVHAQYYFEQLIKRGYLVNLVYDPLISKNSYPYIDPFRSNPAVRFHTVENAFQISLRNLRKLQDDLSADLTIFPEADDHLKLLNSQILPGVRRLRGKTVGMFLRTINYIHFPPKTLSLRDKLRYIRYFHKTWQTDRVLFHEFTLPKFKLLDAALTLDEFFKQTHPRSHQWVPEIIFPLMPDAAELAAAEQGTWGARLNEFLEMNRGKEVLLYFGRSQWRKGYDTLLRLACEEQCCFIHCGLVDDAENYDVNVSEMRSRLAGQGLLFETNAYIQSFQTIQMFFKACTHVVLPYRSHFGSSGVMFQAVYFGKPVLVSDQGLMGKRTSQHGVGQVYRYNDYEDLKVKWNLLRSSLPDYAENLAKYSPEFSKENVVQTMDTIFDRLLSD